MATEPHKSLWRNLGEFFGHIAHAVKHDPESTGACAADVAPVRQVVKTDVKEATIDGAAGEQITLRRTTIDEVEVRPGGTPASPISME